MKEWLGSWPVPFESLASARSFFGGDTLKARVWADSLEARRDGWWPAFDPDVMIASLADLGRRDDWDEWANIRCPVLIVRGEQGTLAAEAAEVMASRLQIAEIVEIRGASHDLHLDRPSEWCRELQRFLSALETFEL